MKKNRLAFHLVLAIIGCLVSLKSFSQEVLYPFIENGKYGYINKTGKVVIDAQYESGNSFSEGLACVKLHGKKGFINGSGKMVIEAKLEDAFDFSEGLACVKFSGKWYYISKE